MQSKRKNVTSLEENKFYNNTRTESIVAAQDPAIRQPFSIFN